MKKNKKGFTLIELLVVVSIISFLSSIVLVSVRVAREKAITAKITEDLRQVRIAAELSYGDAGGYIFSVNDAHQNNFIHTIPRDSDVFSFIKKANAESNIQSIPPACAKFNEIAQDLVNKKYLNSVPVHPRQDYTEGICYKAVISEDQKTLAVYAETPARVNLTVSSSPKKVGFVIGDTSILNLNNIRTQSIQDGSTGYLQTVNGDEIASISDIADEVIGVTSGLPARYTASLGGSSGGLDIEGGITIGGGITIDSSAVGTIISLTGSSSSVYYDTYGVCGYGATLLANGVCEVSQSCGVYMNQPQGPCIYYSPPQYKCPHLKSFAIDGYQNTINGTCVSY